MYVNDKRVKPATSPDGFFIIKVPAGEALKNVLFIVWKSRQDMTFEYDIALADEEHPITVKPGILKVLPMVLFKLTRDGGTTKVDTSTEKRESIIKLFKTRYAVLSENFGL